MSDFTGIWIPAEVLSMRPLTLTEKIVTGQVLGLTRDGECHATNGYLAKTLDLSTRTISHAIKRLSQFGLVCATVEKQAGNHRRVFPTPHLMTALVDPLIRPGRLDQPDAKFIRQLMDWLAPDGTPRATPPTQDEMTQFMEGVRLERPHANAKLLYNILRFLATNPGSDPQWDEPVPAEDDGTIADSAIPYRKICYTLWQNFPYPIENSAIPYSRFCYTLWQNLLYIYSKEYSKGESKDYTVLSYSVRAKLDVLPAHPEKEKTLMMAIVVDTDTLTTEPDTTAPPVAATPPDSAPEPPASPKKPAKAQSPASPKKTLAERAMAFRLMVESHTPRNPRFTPADEQEFIAYWCEQNMTGTTLRFESQKFFDVGKRIATWVGNNAKKQFTNRNANQRREPIPGTAFGKL